MLGIWPGSRNQRKEHPLDGIFGQRLKRQERRTDARRDEDGPLHVAQGAIAQIGHSHNSGMHDRDQDQKVGHFVIGFDAIDRPGRVDDEIGSHEQGDNQHGRRPQDCTDPSPADHRQEGRSRQHNELNRRAARAYQKSEQPNEGQCRPKDLVDSIRAVDGRFCGVLHVDQWP